MPSQTFFTEPSHWMVSAGQGPGAPLPSPPVDALALADSLEEASDEDATLLLAALDDEATLDELAPKAPPDPFELCAFALPSSLVSPPAPSKDAPFCAEQAARRPRAARPTR
jgi:hypothetical protein